MLDRLAAHCRSIADAGWFRQSVIGLILLNAVLLGVETSRDAMAAWGHLILPVQNVILGLFVAELLVRLVAHYPRVGAFFRDGWNVFDFVIVVASMLPLNGGLATVGRLLRLLRVARLVSVSPQLRLIVATMLRSIPSMGHVIVLLSLILYMYGVAGVYLYRDIAPQYFGDLGTALLSLFQIVTVEGWPDMQAAVIEQAPWAWVYFCSFIVIGVFVVINLFIAVVINNLEAAKQEEATASALAAGATPVNGLSTPAASDATVLAQLIRLQAQLDRLERTLDATDKLAPPAVRRTGGVDGASPRT